MKKILLLAILLQAVVFPQKFRLMTYNILNYPQDNFVQDTTTRNPYFRLIISAINPDILVVEEILSQSGVNSLLNNVLNSYSKYSAGVFINGYDTDNAIFFKDSLFDFISNTPIRTALRDINEFRLFNKFSGDTLIIYAAHLKASSGSENEIKRSAEVDALRNVTNKLPLGSNYYVVGDFNVYTSSEAAYQKLLDQNKTGYFLDPINKPGNWNNNSLFKDIHTQSTRGGNGGGLDDRFDFILISQAVTDAGDIEYVNNSYTAFGNDGLHLNKAINELPNNAVSSEIANALYSAADHLPVYAEFSYDAVVPVELAAFAGNYDDNKVMLRWSTVTETNNYGFEIEKAIGDNGEFSQIGFIRSAGSSSEKNYYSYTDDNIPSAQCSYRLKIVDLDGSYSYSNTISITSPVDFTLYQNYPNPFNAATNIKYSISQNTNVKVTLYDALGREVKVLQDNFLEKGIYNIHLTDAGLVSGVYFVNIQTALGSKQIKIVLMK